MRAYPAPGVYRESIAPVSSAELKTGVPAFLGYTAKADTNPENRPITSWEQFEHRFGEDNDSYLADAIRGFFQNGGRWCYVIPLESKNNPIGSLRQGLKYLAELDTLDLVCAPDVMQRKLVGKLNYDDITTMQSDLLEHCAKCGDRFAILDAPPDLAIDEMLSHRRKLNGHNGALYYPWIKIHDKIDFIPPCGHIAGVFARSDQNSGVHKAPANEILDGVLDLKPNLTDAEQGKLNPEGINCLRAFPGRGIFVWGARTLSHDPTWVYVNARRLFLATGRWIEQNLQNMVLEPNDVWLWTRIEREIRTYLNQLFQQGALKGQTAQEAFYVRCDSETNPAEIRDMGIVVTEIGLAPAIPNEFIIIRIAISDSGLTISGLTQPIS